DMSTKILFRIENSKLRCLACPHKCLIAEGKRGICGIRENRQGKLVLLVHSKVVAKHIDPIEKKPLYHFLPGTEIFSIGTVGCNFRCGFCQNWSISQERSILGQTLAPKQAALEAASYPSIAYTYNEPTIWMEYAKDIAKLTPKKKHVFVTNGYFSDEALKEMDFVDAVNIDLKSFNPKFYLKNCGAKLQSVLDNIQKCKELGKWVEVTTLLIPGENDSEEELRDIAQFLAGIDKEMPWHISAFHPDYQMQDKNHTPFATLQKAYKIGKEAGLAYVYLGNVPDEKYNSTYCPKCNNLLIRRRGFHATMEGMKKGKCNNCDYVIKGVWK
ncbi:MAG: AmmeMemoRadiSam system radical SAM enzyme, partial [Nanoarchaeota archaeon]